MGSVTVGPLPDRNNHPHLPAAGPLLFLGGTVTRGTFRGITEGQACVNTDDHAILNGDEIGTVVSKERCVGLLREHDLDHKHIGIGWRSR